MELFSQGPSLGKPGTPTASLSFTRDDTVTLPLMDGIPLDIPVMAALTVTPANDGNQIPTPCETIHPQSEIKTYSRMRRRHKSEQVAGLPPAEQQPNEPPRSRWS